MYKKTVIVMLLIIILCSSILAYKIEKKKVYNEKMYEIIYKQNDEIMNNKNKPKEIIHKSINKQEKTITSTKSYTESQKEYCISANITIPIIDISYPVITETTKDNLKIAPTKLNGPNANQIGNFCIVGHNYKNNTQFSNLKKLINGDIVVLTDLNGISIEYEVCKQYEIYPDNLECLNQETNGKRKVTLITCAKNNKKRLVVECKEKN